MTIFYHQVGGIFHTIRTVINNEGFFALYKGMSPTLMVRLSYRVRITNILLKRVLFHMLELILDLMRR
jgi:hypothetical protein